MRKVRWLHDVEIADKPDIVYLKFVLPRDSNLLLQEEDEFHETLLNFVVVGDVLKYACDIT
jgi:hypothetical protein